MRKLVGRVSKIREIERKDYASEISEVKEIERKKRWRLIKVKEIERNPIRPRNTEYLHILSDGISLADEISVSVP